MGIRIDYDTTLKQIDKITDAAQVLNSERDNLKQISNNLDLIWQGEAASEFKTKLDELIQELEAATKDMLRLDQDILNVVKEIRNTDENLAKDIGKIGKSGNFGIGGFGAGGGGGGFR